MVSCTGLVMEDTTAPTMIVSMIPKMMKSPTTAAFIPSGSSPCGSNVVDPIAKEPFVSASDLMILFKEERNKRDVTMDQTK